MNKNRKKRWRKRRRKGRTKSKTMRTCTKFIFLFFSILFPILLCICREIENSFPDSSRKYVDICSVVVFRNAQILKLLSGFVLCGIHILDILTIHTKVYVYVSVSCIIIYAFMTWVSNQINGFFSSIFCDVQYFHSGRLCVFVFFFFSFSRHQLQIWLYEYRCRPVFGCVWENFLFSWTMNGITKLPINSCQPKHGPYRIECRCFFLPLLFDFLHRTQKIDLTCCEI